MIRSRISPPPNVVMNAKITAPKTSARFPMATTVPDTENEIAAMHSKAKMILLTVFNFRFLPFSAAAAPPRQAKIEKQGKARVYASPAGLANHGIFASRNAANRATAFR